MRPSRPERNRAANRERENPLPDVAAVGRRQSGPGNWILPHLLGRGIYGLEMNSESMEIRLSDMVAGLAVLTFCALPDAQWIICTPDGDRDGSEQVYEWVKFRAGLKRVSPAEADRGRRERIETVLKQAVP